MPSMHRVRLANIKLENGTRVIPDQTYVFLALHALYILENGGGKTSWIQSVLQTVLPNVMLGSRHYKDVVQTKSTGHIAVEWRIDGVLERYVCTGFCFYNSVDSKHELQYFNYVYEYSPRDNFNISSLPFVSEHRSVMGFHELRRFLKNQTEWQVYLPENNGDYAIHLGKYGIHSQEWKSIQEVNGRESSMDKYFENAKSVEMLMERLIVPTLEDAIYATEEAKKSLIQSFGVFQKNLMEIPQIKNNLEEAEKIETHAKRLLAELETLHLYAAAYQGAVDRKQRWLTAVSKAKEDVANLLEKLEHDLASNQSESMELERLQHAQQIQMEHGKTESLQRDMESAKERLRQQEQNLQAAEDAYRFARGNLYFQAYQKAQGDYRGAEVQMQARKAEHDEQLEMYLRKKTQFEQAIARELRGTQSQSDEVEASIQENKECQRENALQRQKLSVEQARLDAVREELETWVEETEAERERLLPIIGPKLSFDPKGVEMEFKTNYRDREASFEQHRLDLDEAESRGRQIAKEERETLALLQTAEESRKDVVRKQEAFEHLSGLTSSAIDPWFRVHTSLYDQETSITLRLKGAEEKASARVQQTRNAVDTLRRQIARYTNRDHIITSDELMSVHDYLEERGVSAEYGVKYVKAQDERFRDQYPHLTRLLPFGLLIREEEWGRVQQLMHRAPAPLKELPTWFFLLERLGSDVPFGDEGAFVRVTSSFSIFQPHEVLSLVEEEVIRQKVLQLESQLQTEEAADAEAKADLAAVQRALFTWNNFLSRYPTRPDFESELAGFNAAIAAHNVVLQEIKEKAQACLSCQNDLRAKMEQWLHDKGSLMTLVRDVEHYAARAALWPEKETRLTEALIRLEEITEQLPLLTDAFAQLERAEKLLSERRDQLIQSKAMLQSKKEQYELGTSDDLCFVPLPTAESEYVAIRAEIQQIGLGITELQKNMDKAKADMESAQQQIEFLKYTIMDMEAHHEHTTPLMVQEREQEVEESRYRKEQASTVYIRHETEHNRQSEQEAVLTKKFTGTYGVDPLAVETPSVTELKARMLLNTQQREKAEVEQKKQNDLWHELDKIVDGYDTVMAQIKDRGIAPMVEEERLTFGPTWTFQHKRLKDDESLAEREKRNAEWKVESVYDAFRKDLQSSANAYVSQMLRQIDTLTATPKRYDFLYVNARFQESFEAVEAYRRKYELDLEQRAKDREEMIFRFHTRVKEMYDAIMEIPKRSRIDWNGKRVRVVEIVYPWREDTIVWEKLKFHLDALLQDLSAMKKQGETEQKMEAYIHAQLRTSVLLSVVSSFSTCEFKVAKPLNDENIVQPISHHSWENVHVWSGGQKYFGYMAVFVSLLSAVRMKLTGSDQSWKVIVADNPFGSASSHHILEPLLAVCNANHVQLVCLTAIRDEGIVSHFDIVYSNRYFHTGSVEIMQSKLENKSPSALRSIHVNFSASS
ncbi:Chromosome segregation ATPase-like protein [Brevibacillus agri BAB-2500]|nr:Chromosome segregation ATPase-like protein [Brevibacillus agri BAB-2500]